MGGELLLLGFLHRFVYGRDGTASFNCRASSTTPSASKVVSDVSFGHRIAGGEQAPSWLSLPDSVWG